jgi:hypothetical protein
MPELMRAVPAEHVAWAYLTQENVFKGVFDPARDQLPLDGTPLPAGLPMVWLLEFSRSLPWRLASYGEAVRQTVQKIAAHSWTEERFSAAELGGVRVLLRGRGEEEPCSSLRDYWAAVRQPEEHAAHAVMLDKLGRGEDLGSIVVYETTFLSLNDGKHRLFAVLEHADSAPTVVATVLRGRSV